MAAEMSEQMINVTELDIQSFAQKLEQFGEGLSPSERVVLGWMLQRAADSDGVQGYASAPVPASQLRSAILEGLGLAIPR